MDQAVVREQLVRLLDGSQAHITLDRLLERFSEDRVNAVIAAVPYSPWRLLEHMRLAQRDILEYMVADDYQEREFPAGYWPPPGREADRRAWRDTVTGFRADLNALRAIARDTTRDLTAPLPRHADHTILRELLIVGNHNSYHLGQLVVLERALGPQPHQAPRSTA